MPTRPDTPATEAPFITRDRYEAFIAIARDRITTRQFDPAYHVPRAHYEMILEAARHAPSGANAQPWFYVVVPEAETKQKIADYFVEEQRARAKLKMKFPTPDYRGLATAPGVIVVGTDFRWTRAFPVLGDGSDLDRMYQQNAERILLQSVAASTMSAHLAAAALGYNVWWITAIGQEMAQKAMKPLLGIPDELSVIDIMCFGPPSAKGTYKRWKKSLPEIMNWGRFDPANHRTADEIETWIRDQRHRVLYRDATQID